MVLERGAQTSAIKLAWPVLRIGATYVYANNALSGCILLLLFGLVAHYHDS